MEDLFTWLACVGTGCLWETIEVVLCLYCWYLVLCSEESVPSKLLGLLHLCLLPLLCIEE